MTAAVATVARSAPAGTVLVVEDDADIRDSIGGILRAEGYGVSACSNGLEALEHLRLGGQTDVILLDLMMPVMDGWEFRVAQKSDPRLASIPVLVLSADTTAKAAAIDAEAYLRKPVDVRALLGSVERTLVASERKRLQATLVETDRLASLGTMAAGVAHEINNPLAFVMANLEYCARALGGDAQAMAEARLPEALAEAREGCARIRTIVSDLQLFSRSSEKADTRDVDVRRVLDSAANIVINEIRVRARLTKDYGEVPLIEANATRLGQVFLNLVLNAAQAIGEGQPSTNEIRLVTRVEDGAVIVEVRDSGAGIRPEIRGKIFEPFFTTKALGVGTGLGLSISHRIVSGMGGELTVESEPGAGATFRVRLPVVAERKAAAPSPRPPPVKTTRRRARVLVLDDEAMMGTMLKRVLQGAHDVEAMTNPDDAIARIVGGEHFDVILCDLMMPGRSGIAVHAALAEQAPDQARRMIFLTGGALDADAQAFLELRSGRVVGKPFEVNELLRTIDEALSAPEA